MEVHCDDCGGVVTQQVTVRCGAVLTLCARCRFASWWQEDRDRCESRIGILRLEETVVDRLEVLWISPRTCLWLSFTLTQHESQHDWQRDSFQTAGASFRSTCQAGKGCSGAADSWSSDISLGSERSPCSFGGLSLLRLVPGLVCHSAESCTKKTFDSVFFLSSGVFQKLGQGASSLKSRTSDEVCCPRRTVLQFAWVRGLATSGGNRHCPGRRQGVVDGSHCKQTNRTCPSRRASGSPKNSGQEWPTTVVSEVDDQQKETKGTGYLCNYVAPSGWRTIFVGARGEDSWIAFRNSFLCVCQVLVETCASCTTRRPVIHEDSHFS